MFLGMVAFWAVGWGDKNGLLHTTHTHLVFLRTLLYKHTTGDRYCRTSMSHVNEWLRVDCVFDEAAGGMMERREVHGCTRCLGRLRHRKRPNSTFKLTICNREGLVLFANRSNRVRLTVIMASPSMALRMSKHSPATASFHTTTKKGRATSSNIYIPRCLPVNLQSIAMSRRAARCLLSHGVYTQS